MEVFPNSPAFKAGLRKGDVIDHFDDDKVRDYAAFVRVISSYVAKKEAVRIGFIREGKHDSVIAELSLEDTFTGMVDVTQQNQDEIRKKREALARQRSGSGVLWRQTEG